MKRSIFLATLALTPSLVHAQATMPAQTASSASVLSATMAPIAPLKPAKSPAAPTTATGLRISTGIIAPKLEKSMSFVDLDGAHNRVLAKDVTVVVDLTVDETGKPTNLSIAQSGGTALDQDVLAAVGQYRFRPGTLDGQPYALPLHLQVLIERGAQY